MALSDLAAELILEIASHIGFEDSSQTNLALTCTRMYTTLIYGILEDRVRYVRTIICSDKPYASKHLFLSSYDGSPVTNEPFGGSYRFLGFRPGSDKKGQLCVQSILARAKDLDAVHLSLGERMTLGNLATLISRCAARPNLSLTVSGALHSEDQLEDDMSHHIAGPFSFEHFFTIDKKMASTPRWQRGLDISSLINRIPLFHQNTPVIQYIKAPSGLAEHNAFIAIPRKPKIELAPGPQCELSSLCIATQALFIPSFFPYTMALLNTAKLTKLSLQNIPLSFLAWPEILPAITIPTLREFSVGKVSIPYPDLLKFLGRRCHQSIEVLDFTDNDAIGAVIVPPLSLSILSRLTSLTAGAEYLVPFLKSRNEGSFPSLQHLGLCAPRAPPYGTRKCGLDPVYELILKGRPYKSIKVDDTANSGIVEWIINTCERWTPDNSFAQLERLFLDNVHLISRESFNKLLMWLASNTEDESPGLDFTEYTDFNCQKAVEQLVKRQMPDLKDLVVRLRSEIRPEWPYHSA